MTFRYQPLREVPADLGDSEVRICSSQFEELTGQPASAHRLRPWKGRVVALTSRAGTIYRVAKGHGNLPLPAGRCWLGPRTRSQLGITAGADLEITAVRSQSWARFLYYNNHLDDAVRFTFRIGFWGLLIAVISLGLSLASLLLPLIHQLNS
jgi:hypothetical protein